MKENNNEIQNWLKPKGCTIPQAALMLSVSEKTIRRFIDRGLLHASKAIRKKLIPYSEIESFFDRTQ